MRKSLVRYQSNPPARISSTTMLIGAVLIGLLIWFILKKQPAAAQYNNVESWDVSYNEDGLPTKITIHREAIRK